MGQDSILSLFYELIRVALGNQKQLSKEPNEREWELLFEMSEKQSVGGIAFLALDIINEVGQKPPFDLLYNWIGWNKQINAWNELTNKRCKVITRFFTKSGFKSCILKGQGNALMYPDPLSRTSGDIDIWVFGDREKITKLVKQLMPSSVEQYHHIDFAVFNDVLVEVHYTPGRLLSPSYNNRFQKWCEEQKGLILKDYPKSNEVVFPSISFNIIYQMAHIMMHFFIEGIGLRHFIDYYYVLLKANEVVNKENVRKTFQDLGMLRFATGVMWIEKELLGLEYKYLIVEPSEKLGLVIKKEMEEGGNFGMNDQRYQNVRIKGLIARGAIDVYRLLTLSVYFPSESFWKIINKMENQKWKIKN